MESAAGTVVIFIAAVAMKWNPPFEEGRIPDAQRDSRVGTRVLYSEASFKTLLIDWVTVTITDLGSCSLKKRKKDKLLQYNRLKLKCLEKKNLCENQCSVKLGFLYASISYLRTV